MNIDNFCEGCNGCGFRAGDYVIQRCDLCEMFKSDEEAALFVNPLSVMVECSVCKHREMVLPLFFDRPREGCHGLPLRPVEGD